MSQYDNAATALSEQLAAQRTTHADLTRAMWAMSPAERVAAMRRSDLTFGQLMAWARRAPHEIPLLNGEWEFIAIRTAEIADV